MYLLHLVLKTERTVPRCSLLNATLLSFDGSAITSVLQTPAASISLPCRSFPTLSKRSSTPLKSPAVRGEPLSAVSQQLLMALSQFRARAFLSPPAGLTCLSLLRPKKHSAPFSFIWMVWGLFGADETARKTRQNLRKKNDPSSRKNLK